MNPDDADDLQNELGNVIGMVPAHIFTGGLDLDQEIGLATISECLDRGEKYTLALARGDEKLRHEFEPLYRLLTGIAVGSIVPILQRINEGDSPPKAMIETIAGIGGLMFFGGIEYAKAMGLNGVGVDLPEPKKKNRGDNEYPETKPNTNISLSEFMKMNNMDVEDLDGLDE